MHLLVPTVPHAGRPRRTGASRPQRRAAPGSAARAAEELKVNKYDSLSDRFLFVPVAIETSGVVGPLSMSFLKDLCHLAANVRHEPRELEWLFQRVSLAVVRGNAHAILSAGRDRDVTQF